jgi:hypothetical protein
MAWLDVSWSFKELITSNKLNQMHENTETVRDRLNKVILHCASHAPEESTTSSSYLIQAQLRIYKPDDYDTFKFGFQTMTDGASGNIKIVFGGLSKEIATTAGTYESKDDEIDISALDAGWYTLSIQIKSDGINATYIKAFTGYLETEAIA